MHDSKDILYKNTLLIVILTATYVYVYSVSWSLQQEVSPIGGTFSLSHCEVSLLICAVM